MSVRTPLKPSAFEASETFELGRFKRARRAYGFDEVALVPGAVNFADVADRGSIAAG